MPPKPIVDGLWQINLGGVNAFLIDDGELTLIDTGDAGSVGRLVAKLDLLGKRVGDIRHVVVTHCHPDHAGAVAAVKRLTNATVYMHPADAALVRKGYGRRPMRPAPGLIRHLMYGLFVAQAAGVVEACAIDREIDDGVELPIAGGLTVIHVPGHCAGQVALLWRRRGVLFAADAASNMLGFGLNPGYEDLQEGLRSLRKIGTLHFNIACFGHGGPLLERASNHFKRTWGESPEAFQPS